MELAVRHPDGGLQLVRAAAQVEGKAHAALEDLQRQELGLVPGLVVVVVHEQGVVHECGELDVDVVVVGIQRGELHEGQLLKAVAVELTVFTEHS